jgi:hypothetical protein
VAPDQLEVLRILEGDLRGGCLPGRLGRQLAECGAPARRRVRDDAAVDGDLRRRYLPALRGRRHEHGARGGAGAAELLPRIGHGVAAAGALRGSPGEVVVAGDVGRRRLDADLRPVGVELLGEQRREAGMGALAQLDVLGDEGDGVVGRDAHEGVGREHPRRRGIALGERPIQAHADQEPHPEGAAPEELTAARHQSARAASWMAARIRT